MNLSIVIPLFNEEESLPELCAWIKKVVDANNLSYEVLLIDDVLATGGTIGAAIELIQRLGGQVIHVLALLEISGLPGRERLKEKYPEIPVTSLVVS